MADWYDRGLEKLYIEISEETVIPIEHVKSIYSYLVNDGLIDYDTEKEYLWDKYYAEDEEDD